MLVLLVASNSARQVSVQHLGMFVVQQQCHNLAPSAAATDVAEPPSASTSTVVVQATGSNLHAVFSSKCYNADAMVTAVGNASCNECLALVM